MQPALNGNSESQTGLRLPLDHILTALPLTADDVREAMSARARLSTQLAYTACRLHKAADGTVMFAPGTEIGIRQIAEYRAGRIGRFCADVDALRIEMAGAALVHALLVVENSMAQGELPDFRHLLECADSYIASLPADRKAFPLVLDLGRSIRCDSDPVRKHYVTALRKSVLCLFLARALGLPESHHRDAFVAGTVAGLGMVCLNPAMLAKERLSDADFEMIRAYPVLGFRILASSAQVSPRVLGSVHDHQKQLDHSGYPSDGYLPDIAAQITGLSTALSAMLWRETAPENAVRILTQPASGSAAKYEQGLLDALTRVWEESDYRGEMDRTVPQDVIDMKRPYDCAVFETLAGLVHFLEHLVYCVTVLQQAETRLQLYIRSGRRNTQEPEKFLAALMQIVLFPRMMGLSAGADLEELFQDPAALREIEEESYTVYMEMFRHARAADRIATSLRQSIMDKSFVEVLGLYERGIKSLFKASHLIHHRSRTPA